MDKSKKNQKKVGTPQGHVDQVASGLWLRFANINFSFYDQPFLTDFQKELKQILVDGAEYSKTMDALQKWHTDNKSKVIHDFLFDLIKQFLSFFHWNF